MAISHLQAFPKALLLNIVNDSPVFSEASLFAIVSYSPILSEPCVPFLTGIVEDGTFWVDGYLALLSQFGLNLG